MFFTYLLDTCPFVRCTHSAAPIHIWLLLGIKPKIATEVWLWQPETCEAAMLIAERYDEAVLSYDRRPLRAPAASDLMEVDSARVHRPHHKGRQTSAPPARTFSGRTPKLSQEERERFIRVARCFWCRDICHVVSFPCPKKATAYFRTGAPSSLLSMLRLSHNWSLKLGDFIGLLVPIEFTKFETKSETSAICSPWSPLTSRWTSSTADCRLIVSRISSHIRSPVREKILGSSINYYQHIFGYSVAALSVCRYRFVVLRLIVVLVRLLIWSNAINAMDGHRSRGTRL
jgi:hypothetical protein